MADRGWSPKACVIGVGEKNEIITTDLKQEWGALLTFYISHKKKNPQDFYNLSDSPALDIFTNVSNPTLLDELLESRYHFVFIVTNNVKDLPIRTKKSSNNDNTVIMIITSENLDNWQQTIENGAIAVLPKEQFYNKAIEFIIDILRFCMFPRFISFDFSDFRVINRRVVKVFYLRSSDDNYVDQFVGFYKKCVSEENLAKGALAIFYFQDCRNTGDYFHKIGSLQISNYSDHCASPSNVAVKILLIV